MTIMTPRQTSRMRSLEKSSIRITWRRASCTSQPISKKWHPLLLLLMVLMVACCLPSSQGFGKSSRSRTTRLSKRLWKELSDEWNNTDPGIITVVNETEEEQLRPSKGLVRGLWRRGVKTSVGVRTIDIRRTSTDLLLFVRGGSSSTNHHLLSHVLDRWARSLALSLAWVVSFQTLGTAMVAYRDDLYELAQRFMSTESLMAARTVKKILTSVHDHGVVDVFSKYPTQELIASIYALSRLQKASQFHERNQIIQQSSPPSPIPTLLLEDLTRYAPFATAAYGWAMDLATGGRLHRGDLQALYKMTKVPPDQIVTVNWEAKTNRPAFFIVRDETRKRLVLSIRGTWSPHDVLTDLCCTPEDYIVGKRQHQAHNGMLEAARGVDSMAQELIAQELEEHPDYSLLLVGHSLGGSVAAVLGTLWENTFTNIVVYAYGAACVMPDRGQEESGITIVSVMSEGDPFSCLSLGHVADVSIALAQLCENPGLRTTILMRTDGSIPDMEERDLQWCCSTMQELHESMVGEKLYPPGKLLFLRREGRHCHAQEVPANFFRDLVIGPRMFDLSRHVPRMYEARLRESLAAATAEHSLS